MNLVKLIFGKTRLLKIKNTTVNITPDSKFILLLAIIFYFITKRLDFISLYVLINISVLIHEFGHVYAANYYGIPCHEIFLWSGGGCAEIGIDPRQAKQEFVVAIAGPLTSFVVAFITLESFIITRYDFLFVITWLNIIMVVFNLLPAFPLDGGRIFRSILTGILKDHVLSTKITTIVSTILMTICVILAVYYDQLFIALVCGMIAFAANHENMRVKREL